MGKRVDGKWWGILFFIWLTFFGVGWGRLDPDFGWHLTMGKYVITHGSVPETDPFSYTMSDFKFVDHEWLSNVGIYLVYEKWGMGALAAITASMVVLALIFLVPREYRSTSLVSLFLVSETWLARGGVRPQVQVWLFLTMLLRMFGDRKTWRKWRWMMPILMMVWANLHGSFALGLVCLGFCMGIRAVEERKIEIKDMVVMGLSILGTLVNPYGLRLWYEVWMQISDNNLRWSIAEWLPFFVTVEFGFMFLLVLGIMLGWKYKKTLGWWKYGLLLVLGVAGLSALRHVALYAVVSGMVIAVSFGQLRKETVVKGKEFEARWNIFWRAVMLITVIIWGWEVFWNLASLGIKGGIAYPTQAVSYLKQNVPTGNLISEYGWGGYLIWQYPEKKVFVDGRMPSWRSADLVPLGKYLYPEEVRREEDDKWVFKTYQELTYKAEGIKKLDKYMVSTVLWPMPRESELVKVAKGWLARFKLNIEKKKTEEEVVDFVSELKDLGWKEVYRDEVALILNRP